MSRDTLAGVEGLFLRTSVSASLSSASNFTGTRNAGWPVPDSRCQCGELHCLQPLKALPEPAHGSVAGFSLQCGKEVLTGKNRAANVRKTHLAVLTGSET